MGSLPLKKTELGCCTVLVDKVDVTRWNVMPHGGPHATVTFGSATHSLGAVPRRGGLRSPVSQQKYRGGSSRGETIRQHTAQASWVSKTTLT